MRFAQYYTDRAPSYKYRYRSILLCRTMETEVNASRRRKKKVSNKNVGTDVDNYEIIKVKCFLKIHLLLTIKSLL